MCAVAVASVAEILGPNYPDALVEAVKVANAAESRSLFPQEKISSYD
jgi:hypothetical protein